MMRIIQGDLNDPRVVALLQIHLTSARAANSAGQRARLGHHDEMLLGMGARATRKVRGDLEEGSSNMTANEDHPAILQAKKDLETASRHDHARVKGMLAASSSRET
jgi:hypothetical protein